MAKQPQRQVGRHWDPFLAGYKLGSGLGMGTSGVVRRGIRKDSGAPCAIKVVTVDAQGATCRFRREAHLLSKLHHESITPLLEYFPPSPAFQREEAVLVFPEREGDLQRFIERRRADFSVGPHGARGGAFPHRVLGVPVGQRVGISSFAKHSAS